MDSTAQSPQNPLKNEQRFTLRKRYAVIALFSLVVLILFSAYGFLFDATKKQTPLKKYETTLEGEHVQNEIIVEFQEGNSPDNAVTKEQLETIGVSSFRKVFESEDSLLKNFYILKLKEGYTARKVKDDILKLDAIKGVELNYVLKAQAVTPNDTYYNNGVIPGGEFAGREYQWNLKQIDMPNAWELSKGSKEVKIGVLDSGIDLTHEDFQGVSVIKGGDFARCDRIENGICVIGGDRKTIDPIDDNGHGTHVTGIIGAATNNTSGVAGMNWNTTIIATKVLDSRGSGDVALTVEGMRHAVDGLGAKIINMSLGSEGELSCPIIFKTAINYAVSKGTVIVGAAGNSNGDASKYAPGSCENILIAGATDPNDKKASFSNWGTRVDIWAPGVLILSLRSSQCNGCPGANTVPDGKYIFQGGTSSATPHVAGAVALLLSRNPSLSFGQVKNCLIKNTDSTEAGPRLNVFKMLSSECAQVPSPTPTLTVSPTGVVPSPTPTPIPTGRVPTVTPSPTLPVSPKIGGSLSITKKSSETSPLGLCFSPKDVLTISAFGTISDSEYRLSKISVQYRKMRENNRWSVLKEKTDFSDSDVSQQLTFRDIPLPSTMQEGDYHVIVVVEGANKKDPQKTITCSGSPYKEELDEFKFSSCGAESLQDIHIRADPSENSCTTIYPFSNESAVTAPVGSLSLSKSCVQVGKNETITVAVAGVSADKENPIARVGVHFKKYGSNDPWSDILYKNVADTTSYGEKVTWNTSSLSEGKYYVVVNMFAHKAGNPFVEKACSGSPYELAWKENKMVYCGTGSRAMVNVAKDCSVSQSSTGNPSSGGGGGTSVPPGTTVTPRVRCEIDPNCGDGKSISLCPLICR